VSGEQVEPGLAERLRDRARIADRLDGDGASSVETDDLRAAAVAVDERDALRLWKSEALTVLAEWEKVHDALGQPAPLGAFKSRASLLEVERLIAERDALQGHLDQLLEAIGDPEELRRMAADPPAAEPFLRRLAAAVDGAP
jgi:hypothetical protein